MFGMLLYEKEMTGNKQDWSMTTMDNTYEFSLSMFQYGLTHVCYGTRTMLVVYRSGTTLRCL